MNHRRGLSLVELLLAMTACISVLTLSVALIHRVMHAQTGARGLADAERSAVRLSTALRDDVHRAKSASVPEAPAEGGIFLRLQLPDGQAIEFQQADGAVLRLVLERDKTISREQFSFPANIELTVRQPTPRLISLSITALPENAAAGDGPVTSIAYAVPLSLEIQAVVDRDGLFAAGPPTEGAP